MSDPEKDRLRDILIQISGHRRGSVARKGGYRTHKCQPGEDSVERKALSSIRVAQEQSWLSQEGGEPPVLGGM